MDNWQQQLDEEQYRHRRLPKPDNTAGPSSRWSKVLLAESTADLVEFPHRPETTPATDTQAEAS